MECLDEETILAFGGGSLSAAVRAEAEEHIATCDECRQLVSAVARASFVDPEEREDLPRGPLLVPRVDPAMAPTTPIGTARGGSGAPTASPVQPGEILAGKFQVERVLGAGGMGIVVAARHTQLDQRVALKFLLPAACEVPGAVARFLREGKAAARITSEHVARVMDTGVLGADGSGAPYLVMEYLEGSDLGAVIQRRGRVSVDEAVEYVLQACEAIVEAHDLGIVHRDLKPANLFLSKRADGSPLVKVLDFGISKQGGGSRSQLTSASVLMGSPRYMSPEQMMSAKDVDARTDVWALGVILYELVTGKPVWQADTMQGLCALIASSPAPSLRVLRPDAPEVLADVVARCLTKSRDERIASVADLALELEPIAPATARTSIDRILRVARKDRGTSTGPKKAPLAATANAGGDVAAADASRVAGRERTTGPRRGASSRAAGATTNDAAPAASPKIGVVLAAAVGALLVAGIAINATRARPSPLDPSQAIGPAVGPAPGVVATAPSTAAASASSAAGTLPSAQALAAPGPSPSAVDEGTAAPSPSSSLARRLLRAPATPPHAAAAATATATATAATTATAAPNATTTASTASDPRTAPSANRALTDRK
jgi:serine/threonine-protein kinase